MRIDFKNFKRAVLTGFFLTALYSAAQAESTLAADRFLPPAVTPPPWMHFASAYTPPEKKPMIAIIIDDMGMSRRHSDEVAAFEGAITLAYLPYAPDVRAQAQLAHALGHEILAHVPMEPENEHEDTGPDPLLTGLSKDELAARITKNLDALDGYIGVNNHMGSKFTKNKDGLDILMAELKKRGLLFIDSRSDPASIAEKTARDFAIPAARRDVFLDHDESSVTVVQDALKHAEAVALKQGSAIAIGHPRAFTIEALKDWLPKAKAAGFAIVPLTAVLRFRDPDLVRSAPLRIAAAKIAPAVIDSLTIREVRKTSIAAKTEEAAPLPAADAVKPAVPALEKKQTQYRY